MSALRNKPRVTWDAESGGWYCSGSGVERFSYKGIVTACKKWFDEVYGKGNHGYR